MLSKKEYDNVRSLWFRNQKAGEPICEKCNEFWDELAIENEPITEFQTLTVEDRTRSTRTLIGLDDKKWMA